MTNNEIHKIIVAVDLSHYSVMVAELASLNGANASLTIENTIKELVLDVLRNVGITEPVPTDWVGDAAILAMDTPQKAVQFAANLHQAADGWNRRNRSGNVELHFRIGIASGGVVLKEDSTFSGPPIIDAVRLEAACVTGEILATSEVRDALPTQEQDEFDLPEIITDKLDVQRLAYRRKVVGPAQWDVDKTTLAHYLAVLDCAKGIHNRFHGIYFTGLTPLSTAAVKAFGTNEKDVESFADSITRCVHACSVYLSVCKTSALEFMDPNAPPKDFSVVDNAFNRVKAAANATWPTSVAKVERSYNDLKSQITKLKGCHDVIVKIDEMQGGLHEWLQDGQQRKRFPGKISDVAKVVTDVIQNADAIILNLLEVMLAQKAIIGRK